MKKFKDTKVYYWYATHFKYPIQRAKHGFSDEDVDNIDEWFFRVATDIMVQSAFSLSKNPEFLEECEVPVGYDSAEDWLKDIAVTSMGAWVSANEPSSDVLVPIIHEDGMSELEIETAIKSAKDKFLNLFTKSLYFLHK